MKQALFRIYNKLRHPGRLFAALQRRQRLSKAGSLPVLQTFWREQGREWMGLEATGADLLLIDTLVRETSALSGQARHFQIIAALQNAWSDSFRQSGDGIEWNMMQEDLPDEALVCFFEGALQARESRRKPAG